MAVTNLPAPVDEAVIPRPPEDDPESDDKRMTIQEHLEELRNRLIISCIAVVVGMVPGAIFATDIWKLMIRLIETEDGQPKYPVFTGAVVEGFMTWLWIAIYVGLALATPVIVYQVSAFVAPALTRQEKRFLITVLPAVLFFFLAGVVFSYFLVLPNALNFLAGFGTYHLPGTTSMIRLENFIDFVLTLLFWVGLSFETPVVVVALKRIGILNDQRIKSVRKYFIVIAFVVAAFITPTPDPLNQIIIAVPIIILYEIGVLLAKVV